MKSQVKDYAYYQCMWGPAFELEMPNVFTPNDDYKNDQFVPLVKNEICLDSYHLRVFNRWGQQLFESWVHNVGWTGMSIYGHSYEEGNYFYIVDYTYHIVDGNSARSVSRELKGFFLLAR
jgi:gliding motility-associated-like protein